MTTLTVPVLLHITALISSRSARVRHSADGAPARRHRAGDTSRATGSYAMLWR